MRYYVYLLANGKNGTLYVGVTSNLVQRVHQHKNNLVQGFSQRYGLHDLVWFEQAESVLAATEREKELKNWKREWKIALIEKDNPAWGDLYESICG